MKGFDFIRKTGIKEYITLGIMILWTAVVYSLLEILQLSRINSSLVNFFSFWQGFKLSLFTTLVFASIGFVIYFFLKRLSGKIQMDIAIFSFAITSLFFLVGGYIINSYFLSQKFSITSIVVNLFIIISGILTLIICYLISEKLYNNKLFACLILMAIPALIALAILFTNVTSVEAQVKESVSIADNEASDLPNIVFILIDTLRADHLSCYGYDKSTSPTIDSVAEKGIRFNNAFSQSSWTKPSVSSIFSSKYCSQHNCNTVWNILNDNIVTLPEYLKSYGYNTFAFSANIQISPIGGFGQGVDYFSTGKKRVGTHWLLLKEPYDYFNCSFIVKLLTKETIINNVEEPEDFVLNQLIYEKFNSVPEFPYFLYVHYMSPHDPYHPPEPYIKKFRNNIDEETKTEMPEEAKNIFQVPKKSDFLSQKERSSLISSYDGEILYVDTMIKEFLKFLKDKNMDKNTLFIITSDHGEEFYDHKNWGHGNSLYNEVINIPLILYYDKHLSDKRIINNPVESIDIYPTILDIVGLPQPDNLEGESLVPYMQKEIESENSGDTRIYSELLKPYYKVKTLIKGNYKYTESYLDSVNFSSVQSKTELFNLKMDFRETQNILKERDLMKEKLSSEMEEFNKILQQSEYKSEKIEKMDKETKEELKALGYID